MSQYAAALAKNLARGVPYVHTDVSLQDTAADVLAKVFDRSVASLIAMRNQVDPKLFERAAEALAKAEKDKKAAIEREVKKALEEAARARGEAPAGPAPGTPGATKPA